MITLLSFAASVTLTRLFLELTGYPQIGGGQLHIAHVLWGGLLLFLASILPLTVANRWAYIATAFLSGTGVGLFIDEVGKFITANNDYFFPLAAPIIYTFFLLTVILYMRVRRPSNRGPRAEMYRVFEAMEEVLEFDLDPRERSDLEERLERVSQQSDNPELARLAQALHEYISHDTLSLVEERLTLLNRSILRWQEFERNRITHLRLKIVLSGGLLAMGVVALLNMFSSLPIQSSQDTLENIMTRLIAGGQITNPGALYWFLARVGLETVVGMLLLIAAGLLIANRESQGTFFGYWSLLLSLTTVNLLVFYFDQFSAILTALIQFALLMGIVYYRHNYVWKKHAVLSDQIEPTADESWPTGEEMIE